MTEKSTLRSGVAVSMGRLAFAAMLAGVGVLGAAAGAGAQTLLPPAAVPPVNVMLPNDNGVPVGEVGSLEAGAFLARANDTSSVFYNPAGLARAERTSVSGSAGVFQFDSVSPRNLNKSGTSFQQIPAMFGFVLTDLLGRPNWAGGLSVARVNAWSQEVAAERTFEIGAANDRVSYTSSAEIAGWLASLGVGVSHRDKLRVGVATDVQLTITERSQTFGDQFRGGAGLNAVLVDAKGSARAMHLRVTVGGQYDVTPAVQLGAVVRTRGIGLLSSGSYALEGLSRIGSTTTTASFFDDDATVQYRIPLELKVGAAYTASRGQVEVDVLAHQAAGVYTAFSSSRSTTINSDPGTGAVTVQQVSSHPDVVDSRAVVNVEVGGHFKLTADGKWLLHGGYGTDRSPVGDKDTVFTKVHLQKGTVGVSGRTKYFLASFGVQYATGSSEVIPLRQLQNGQQFSTNFDVSNLGFVYSLALLF